MYEERGGIRGAPPLLTQVRGSACRSRRGETNHRWGRSQLERRLIASCLLGREHQKDRGGGPLQAATGLSVDQLWIRFRFHNES